MQNVAKTYFQTQFTTMGQGEVLLLLYDGALKFLAQAKEKILVKDYGAKGIAISKALDIISELDATLNPEAGGDLATNLHQLYFICSTRLLRANLKMDISLIDGVMDVLTGLRSAYAEILNRPDAQAASRQIASKQKAFDIKGRADTPQASAPVSAPTGGMRAQAAYDVAARQLATTPAPAVPAAPSQYQSEAASVTEEQLPGITPSVNRSASTAYGRAVSQYRP